MNVYVYSVMCYVAALRRADHSSKVSHLIS
jgi:hypothetical protein